MNAQDVLNQLATLDANAERAMTEGLGDMVEAFQVAMLAIQQGALDQGICPDSFQGSTFGFSND